MDKKGMKTESLCSFLKKKKKKRLQGYQAQINFKSTNFLTPNHDKIELTFSAPSQCMHQSEISLRLFVSTCIPKIWQSYIKFNYLQYEYISIVCVSCIWLCDPMNYIAYQAPLSMEFFRQEYWSGLPRDQTLVSCIASRFLTIWTTREGALNLCISVLDCYKLYFVSTGQSLLEKVNLSLPSFIKRPVFFQVKPITLPKSF